MNVLQVNKLYYPWIGGVEKIVQDISEGLNSNQNIEIEVLCCQPKGRGIVESINGVNVYRASSLGIIRGMPLSLSFFRIFRKLIKKADIVNFHQPFPLADLALFLFKPPRKIITHYHSDIVRQRVFEFLLRPFILNTLKRSNKILVSNPNLIKSSNYLARFKDRCLVNPFGVDLEEINGAIDKSEIEEISAKYKKFILFIGRLSYYKGVEYLIRSVQDIDVNLVVIGSGRREKALKELAKSLRLENKIFFLPPQPRKKLINFFKAAKIFVLPSIHRSEAFGIVLIEAMACGTPVISTNIGTGTSWINVDNETGLVVEPKNHKALQKAIKKILSDESLAGTFSKKAKERVQNLFIKSEMINKVLTTYNES